MKLKEKIIEKLEDRGIDCVWNDQDYALWGICFQLEELNQTIKKWKNIK